MYIVKKLPNKVADLGLDVGDFKSEVVERRSRGIPLNLTPGAIIATAAG